MTEEDAETNRIIRAMSGELGVAEDVIRSFAERNNVDLVATAKEKHAVMRRRATDRRRMMLGGITSAVRVFSVGTEVEK